MGPCLYNQWYWAFCRGDGLISVRPLSSYAEEGPSVCRNELPGPFGWPLSLFTRLFHYPRTLLLIRERHLLVADSGGLHAGSFGINSEAISLSAASLVPLCPLLWPLAGTTFASFNSRCRLCSGPFKAYAAVAGLTTFGVAAMLCCRQEFAVMAATFAFLPSREPENLTQTLKWPQALFAIGLG